MAKHKHLGLALLLCGVGVAQGQHISVPPSAAAECLQTVDGSPAVPDYPEKLWRNHEQGEVEVELRFTAPDRAPELKVVRSTGHGGLVDAVTEFAKKLRTPCLAAGQPPAVLSKLFVFKEGAERAAQVGPTLDVRSWRLVQAISDDGDPEGAPNAPFSCRLDGMHGSAMASVYTPGAIRANLQGGVTGVVEFEGPNVEPRVTMYAPKLMDELGRSLQDYLQKNVRMTCVRKSKLSSDASSSQWPADAVRLEIDYLFRLEDSRGKRDKFGLRNTTLLDWLRSVTEESQKTLVANTNVMGCPFDVELTYRQPLLRNRVKQLGDSLSARQPLVEWLERSQLPLGDRSLHGIYATQAVIQVPCVNIDMTK